MSEGPYMHYLGVVCICVSILFELRFGLLSGLVLAALQGCLCVIYGRKSDMRVISDLGLICPVRLV